MMYTMPKNLLSICVNFTLATQQCRIGTKKLLTFALEFGILLKLSLRDKRKTEKFGLEPIEVLKKNLKKVLDKRFWF